MINFERCFLSSKQNVDLVDKFGHVNVFAYIFNVAFSCAIFFVDFKIKRFFQFLNEMIRIANEIEKKGLMEDEIMYNVWDLITDFDDDVTNEMPIGSAQDYLEIRLSDIIAALQGEEVVVGGY